MNVERALAVIAAHGGDAAAWPEGERAAVAALAASDGRVGAALAEARALDVLLGAWAVDVVPRDYDAAALIAGAGTGAGAGEAVARSVLPRAARGWLAGAMLAAAAATGLVVLAPFEAGPAAVAVGGVGTGASAGTGSLAAAGAGALAGATGAGPGDDEVFAMLFTPTAEEDELI